MIAVTPVTLEQRAVDFLKNEGGRLGSVYQIMAAFAEVLVSEEREALANEADKRETAWRLMAQSSAMGPKRAVWLGAMHETIAEQFRGFAAAIRER